VGHNVARLDSFSFYNNDDATCYIGVNANNKSLKESYRLVSYRDILYFVDMQPDRIIDKKLLVRKYVINQLQASSRLRALILRKKK